MPGPAGRDTPRRARVTPGGPGLPHDWETERAVLASLLLDATRLDEVAEVLDAEDFARPQHAELYTLIRRVVEAHGTCDLTLLLDFAQRSGELEERYGGASYLMGLAAAAPTPEFAVEYAQRVRDHAVRRRLALTAKGILDDVGAGELETPELLDRAQSAVMALSEAEGTQGWRALADLVTPAVDAARERAEHPGAITGVTTGLVDLDRQLAGLQRTDLIILAARPAMGKTAFALNLAASAARTGAGVGIFSMEMSAEQLVQRMMCAHGRVDAGRIRTGDLQEGDWARYTAAADVVHGWPIHIDDTRGLTITELRARARRLRARMPDLGLVVVDYLQLMQSTGGMRESRENAVSNMSRGLKILAGEIGVPVVALSQLNRSLESRSDKRPLPSDLRESGAIEQDADVILFLYRDEYYNPESPDRGVAEVIVAKQRSGPTGTVKVAWLPQYTLFSSLARDLDGYA